MSWWREHGGTMLMIAALLLIFNDPNDIARGAAGLAAAAAGVIGR